MSYADRYSSEQACKTKIAPVSLCALRAVGMDDHGEIACRHHATYRFDFDARPLVDDCPVSAFVRAMFAAHDARVAFPELKEAH